MSADQRPRQLDGPIWRAPTPREVDAELAFHVEMLTRELLAAGHTPEAAAAQVRARFGDLSQVSAAARRAATHRDRTMRLTEHLAAIRQDVVHAFRLLRRAPGFTIVAVLTLALGIGANSAIFSVVNGVALKPLGYPEPDRLVYVTSQFASMGFDEFWVSPPEYFEYREQTRALGALGAYATGAVNLSEGASPERTNAVAMTASMFDVLGVRPLLGRPFTAAEDLPNADPVVVIGHELWQRSFGGDPGIVGRRVEIDGTRQTVVGVMPPGFDLHDARAQVWQPLALDPSNRENRGSHFLYLVGRLADGVTREQADAELHGLLRGRWRELVPSGHVPNDSTHRLQMAPLRDEVIGSVRTALWVLQGAVGLVLLIACANMANLLLARAETRHKEFAIRAALGAGRGHVLRQFLVEGIIVALLGAAVGLAFAHWGLRAILALNPDSVPRAAEIGLDPLVLAFTAAVAVLTGAIFGLAPLLHVRERALAGAMRDGGTRGATVGGGRARVRRGLAVAEVALAVTLVVGAGLLLRSFWNLTRVDAGFDRTELVTFAVVLPQATYADPANSTRFFTDLTAHLQRIPGVEAVSAMSGLPPHREVNANDTEFEGIPQTTDGPLQNVDYYQVTTAQYFETMRIPLRRGRGFVPGDVGGPPVIVINEALAQRFYPDVDPVGRRMRPSSNSEVPWFTIVGVAADVKQGGLDAEPGTEMYFLYDQAARDADYAPSQMNIVLRTPRPLGDLLPEVRRTVAELDPALPLVQPRTMEDVFADSVSRQRFLSQLLGVFAAVALLLSAVGTYGILAYMVNERRREIGIRMALGAGRGSVLGLILGQGLGIAGVGIAIGLAAAFALSRVATSLLYGVSPADPLTFAVVAGIIALVALVACVVPARRASRVDPLVAMQAD
jgi:predicted permease